MALIFFAILILIRNDNLSNLSYNYLVAGAAAVVSATLAVSTTAGAGVSTGATTAAVSVAGAASSVLPPPHEVNVAAINAIAKNFFIVVFFLV